MRVMPALMRPSLGRSFRATAVAAGLSAVVVAALAGPATAMPERYADAGTIVWCEGEGGYLEAYDTTMTPATWFAGIWTEDGEAYAHGETALLVGDELSGTFPAFDPESGEELGDLTIDGTIEWGETEVVSGWDVNPDGWRYRSEGTRIPLSGSVTLTLGETSTTLSCTGWEIHLETFQLTPGAPASNSKGWWQDGYELEGGAGTIGFYGERKTELGIALDLVEPYSFAGERLQVRNGEVEGTLLLRDPETAEVVGAATVSGTVTRTGSEQVVDAGKGYKYVSDIVYYDVSLTITTEAGEWSGTWPATHETIRSRATIPPKAL